MTAITINTGGLSNLDDSANLALANGETITISNGSTLVINSDNRWSQQAAVIGNITIDSSTGGTCLVDGTTVWWLPYTSGTGNVPAIDTTISQGGVSGKLLGVWSAMGVSPTSTGSAMPSSGFIKLRSVTGGAFSSGALSGIGASSSGQGQRGWINVVGAESTTLTASRTGLFKFTGDWFDLGTTSGSANQQIQHFVAEAIPAIWIETAPGSGTYEIYPNAGSRFTTTYIGTDTRGKYVTCSSTGLIRIGSDGTNNVGYVPVAGCKIRVPNIHVSAMASPYTTYSINATLGTRWDFTVTSSGLVDMDKVICTGLYLGFTRAYSLELSNVAAFHQLSISETSSPATVDNVCVGLNSTTDMSGLIITDNTAGINFSNSTFCRYSTNGSGAGTNITDSSVMDFTNCRMMSIRPGNTAYGWYFSRCDTITMTNCVGEGNRAFFNTVSDATITNFKYTDNLVGSNSSSNSISAICFDTRSNNIVVDGFSLTENGTLPYASLFSISASSNITFKNIGSAASRLNLSGHTGYVISSSGSNLKIKLQRIYVTGTRTNISQKITTDDQFTFDNVWGDAADETTLTGSNIVSRGGYSSSGAFGTSIPTILNSYRGVHFYDAFGSDTQGRIGIFFTEKTNLEPSNSAYQIISGTPLFNYSGGLMLRAVGDAVEYTWGYFIKGYTSLANVAPATNGTNIGNLTITYDIDTGSGFTGSYKTCNATNLSAETGISATTGFRLRIRFECATAATTNVISGFYITGTTDATSQQNQYPLNSVGASAYLYGLVPGSKIRVYRTSDDVLLSSTDSSGTTFSYNYLWEGSDINIYIVVYSLAYQPVRYENLTLSSTGLSIPVQQIVDRVYVNPA